MNTTGIVSDWIARVNAGDPKARNELLRHAQRRLEMLIHRMLRQFSNVTERTGDVLTGVMLRMDRAVQNKKLATSRDYFNLAAFNIRLELLDIAKKRQFVGILGSASALESPYQEEPGALAVWAEIHTWIAALPDCEAELWNLLWYSGLNQDEAALLLDLPRTTMRRRWLATRLRFMERFGKDLEAYLK